MTAVAWTVVAVSGAWLICGLAAARSRSGRPLSFLMAGFGVAAGAAAGSGAADIPVVASVLGGLAIALAFHMVLSLPSGRLGSPGRQRLATLGYVVVVAIPVASALDATAGFGAAAVTGVVLAAIALVAAYVRAGTSSRSDRSRLHWDLVGVVAAATLALLVGALSVLTGWPTRPAPAALAATALVPVGLAASCVDRFLGQGGRILVRVLVLSGLALSAAAVYLGVVVGLGGVPEAESRRTVALSLVAAALVVAFVIPWRIRLVTFANQLVHGGRTSPDEALRTFGSRLSRSLPMDELLLQLAESLRSAMDLSAVEVWVGADGRWERQVALPHAAGRQLRTDADELAVAARARVVGDGWLKVWVPELLEGRERRRVRLAPMAHLGEVLGFILAERPLDAAPFDETTDRVLVELARQVGLALHNVRLDSALQESLEELQRSNRELQASRARIVAAADESRRRIERDLHDGAQQHLVAVAVKLGLARRSIARGAAGDGAGTDGVDPEHVQLLDELRDDVQESLEVLRELAHGIYPPLLRERGLGEALRAAAARATRPTTVDVDLVDRAGTEAEAAIYFCCLEAMQNAQKHAGPDASVAVRVAERDGELRFQVADDGAGFDPEQARSGQGFLNMTDRLGAIGGELSIASEPGAGTTVSGSVRSARR